MSLEDSLREPRAMSSGSHGFISPFDGNQEEWIDYAEHLENYFIANDITDIAKQRAILLNGVGPTTYRLIKTLCLPGSPKEYKFEELVERVRLHFNPKPSVIVKRFEFNTRKQRADESVSEFVAALRKITEYCEYGDRLNEMLRDRLVCGIYDKRVQRRFLQDATLTYDGALAMALAAESAAKDSKRLQEQSLNADTGQQDATVEDKPVHRVAHRPQKRSTQAKTQPQQPRHQGDCHRCGGKHLASRCRFKEYECHFCKKKGHLASVCRKKRQAMAEAGSPKTEQANLIEEDIDTDSSEDDHEYMMYSVGGGGSTQPLVVDVQLNGISFSMEVDTGASVSIMSEVNFQPLKENGVALKAAKARLFTYTGEAIAVAGMADVKVEYNGQCFTLPLTVTKGDGPSLLGRNWLLSLKLDWHNILSVKSAKSLQDVLDKYPEVFQDKLGCLKGLKAQIHVDQDATPVFHKARSVPFALRAKVEKELDRLRAEGIIQPVQFADWAAPIVPVIKTDGSVRICGDYKVTVNKAAKIDKYPIPRIEDLFASLSGGRKFSKLDLSHAYQQLELDKSSRPYVTINTHKGLFTYNRLPFGVSSAPSIFQRVMETVLQGIDGVCVYIDDILVTGATDDQHLDHLDKVLKRLQEAGLKLKKDKCSYLLPSVEYLGHIISAEGLQTSDSKVSGIVNAPTPKSVSELRSFLGLVNYYHKFLPDLATTLAPLYALLQKKQMWSWKQEQEEAFNHVKQLLQSSRVLVHFDPSLPLILECDASPYGVGAVLSHRMANNDERPICFASRSLSDVERRYSQLDKEALALVFGVKKYHQYLYGRKFELKTDHKPLVHIFGPSKSTPAMASSRIQRWALTLGAYSYSIQYKKGKENSNADALSRLPLSHTPKSTPKPAEVVHLMEYLDTTPTSSTQVRVWTERDPKLSKVREWILTGWPAQEIEPELQPYFRRKDELSVEDGCVLWGTRVVIPKRGRDRVVKMLHEAHPGIVRMKTLARGYVWWPGIDGDLERKVKECETCQVNQKSPPLAPLHPWSWPQKPWSRVHIDYAGPIMGRMFLLIIDAHSKWLDIHMTTATSSSATISLLRKSFAALGLPEVVVSDNAPNFTSEEFEVFMKKNAIKHIKTPPYHPASNGVVERAVQTFKDGMKKQKNGTIETKLSRFLFKYRITPHSSTGISPAQLMYGRRIRSHLDCIRPDLGKKTRDVQQKQKQSHDRHARSREFQMEDLVYVKNNGQGDKWEKGKVVGRLGQDMYVVLMEDGRCVRKHLEQLRNRECTTESNESESDKIESNSDIEEIDIPTPTETRSNSETRVPLAPPGSMENAPLETESARVMSGGQPRRSARPRQPPDRYGH